METSAAAVGLVAGVGSVITIVSKTILSLNTARLKFSEADLSVELLVGQLYTVRTALNQVQAFVQESFGYDEQHEGFATDLCVAVEHCKLLVQHIDDQVSRLDWLPGEHLQTRGKARLLLEERILRDNIQLLNSQMSGINLCVTAFKARPTSPSKDPLERGTLSRQEDAIIDDTASGQLAADLMTFPPPSNLRPVSRSGPRMSFIKRFDLERLSLKTSFYEHGFRSLSRASGSHGASQEAQEHSPTALKPSMLKLSNSMAQSARVDSLIKRDADRRWRNIKMLAVGQRSATTIKRIQYALAAAPSPEEVEGCRRVIVSSAIRALLALVEHVGNTVALFEIVKRQADICVLESFLADGGPDWVVTSEISSAAMSLWLSPRVQECYKERTREASAGYFLRATGRLLQVDYKPTRTDLIKIGGSKDAATESRITVDDILVNIIDAPQPKLNRLIKHFDDADAYLLSLDLSSYDEYVDGHDVNSLEVSIKAIKRRWKISRRDKPVLLVMYHAAAFNRKLTHSALSKHFPDYRGKDFSSAKDYILRRCREALNHEQALFHHYSDDDAEDTAILEFFKETVVQLPHLIACIRNLEQYLGLTSPLVIESYKKKSRKPSMQLRASF